MKYHPLLVGLLSLGGIAACAPVQLQVPSELAEHRLEVARHGRELTIGEFSIRADQPKSRIKRTSFGAFLQDEQVRETHLFGFTLVVDGLVEDEVACERDSNEKYHSIGVAEFTRSTHRLSCVLTAPDGTARGQLTMNADQSVHHLRGQMVRSEVELELVPSEHSELADSTTGDAFAPAGYELRVGGVQVGAVQTVNGEVVWIDKRAPSWLRKYVALASAVLLLHSEIHYAEGPRLSKL